jgi:hypothetical protein
MAKKRENTKSGARKDRHPEPGGDRETYHGHEIFIPRDDSGRRVVLDGEPLRYGESADGFYLSVYAYDRDPSLLDVIKRYIDYRDAVAERRGRGGGR